MDTEHEKKLYTVKKERKQYEQDAALLSNRIKLLQLEEEKTWKHIKETQRKKTMIEEYRRIKEEKLRQRDQISQIIEKQREENQQKIKQLKFEIEKNKYSSKQTVQTSKRNAYIEIRRLKENLTEQKNKNDQDSFQEKKKRSSSVKVDHIKQGLRKRKFEEIRQNKSKDEYFRKIDKELEAKQELENRVHQMEALELELIKRIQNTQNIQQKVISEFETMKKKPFSVYK